MSREREWLLCGEWPEEIDHPIVKVSREVYTNADLRDGPERVPEYLRNRARARRYRAKEEKLAREREVWVAEQLAAQRKWEAQQAAERLKWDAQRAAHEAIRAADATRGQWDEDRRWPEFSQARHMDAERTARITAQGKVISERKTIAIAHWSAREDYPVVDANPYPAPMTNSALIAIRCQFRDVYGFQPERVVRFENLEVPIFAPGHVPDGFYWIKLKSWLGLVELRNGEVEIRHQ